MVKRRSRTPRKSKRKPKADKPDRNVTRTGKVFGLKTSTKGQLRRDGKRDKRTFKKWQPAWANSIEKMNKSLMPIEYGFKQKHLEGNDPREKFNFRFEKQYYEDKAPDSNQTATILRHVLGLRAAGSRVDTKEIANLFCVSVAVVKEIVGAGEQAKKAGCRKWEEAVRETKTKQRRKDRKPREEKWTYEDDSVQATKVTKSGRSHTRISKRRKASKKRSGKRTRKSSRSKWTYEDDNVTASKVTTSRRSHLKIRKKRGRKRSKISKKRVRKRTKISKKRVRKRTKISKKRVRKRTKISKKRVRKRSARKTSKRSAK